LTFIRRPTPVVQRRAWLRHPQQGAFPAGLTSMHVKRTVDVHAQRKVVLGGTDNRLGQGARQARPVG
jgi:hypothetical protein